jgi:hypothetical protein
MTCEMLQHYINTAPDEATKAALLHQWQSQGCEVKADDDGAKDDPS